MKDEWDAEVLCPIEEDEVALMVMMGDHIDYEDDWIIDSGCSNNMTNSQSGLKRRKYYYVRIGLTRWLQKTGKFFAK